MKVSLRHTFANIAKVLAIFVIAAIFSLVTGEDYAEQSIVLMLCMVLVTVCDLDDKADELLGDLPAKVLECPYGYGKCEPRPTGLKPCGYEEPEITQPLPKIAEGDSGRD